MSIYMFPPISSNGVGHNPYCVWNDGFTEEDIALICEIGESRPISEGIIGGLDAPLAEKRKSKVSWIDNQPDAGWLYDRMASIARNLNSQFYRFDLWGFHDHFQYTIYEAGDSHYDWHQDPTPNTYNPPRKFSLVLQLSDPEDYEGGNLEIFADKIHIVEKKKGMVTGFPSYMPHRVTPVVSGVRKSLVVWVCGPPFK